MENKCQIQTKLLSSSPISHYVYYSGEGKGNVIETTMMSQLCICLDLYSLHYSVEASPSHI